jgi:integrase
MRAPKYGSERVVQLDTLVDLLAKHIVNYGTMGKDQSPFAGVADEPPAPEHRRTLVAYDPRDAGLSGIGLPHLRHFYASSLIAAGCDVGTVQRSLGHAEASTTLNTYAHLWPTAQDRTRKAAEPLMSVSLWHREAPKFPDDLSRRHPS